MKKHFTLFCFALGMVLSLHAQTLYVADFTTDGDGFPDHTTSTPPAAGPQTATGGASPNDWTVSYTDEPSTDGSANEFSVNSGVMRIQDWGDESATWESASIDVSGVNNIDIQASGATIGTAQNAGGEFFEYFYQLDGGSRVTTSVNTGGSGSAVNYDISNLDVSGASTLVVGFSFLVNGGGDGYEISSFEVTENVPSTDTELNFNLTSSSIDEDGGTIDVCVDIINESATTATTVEVALDAASTATEGMGNDFTASPALTATLTFPAGSTADQCVTFTINDDSDIEGAEDIVLTLQNAGGGTNAGIGTNNTHTLTINDDDVPSNDVIINEVLGDPAPGAAGDANQDGISNTSEDEFIEFYNNGADIDLTGWRIDDAATNGTASPRHTFTSGTFTSGTFLVVFGGGTPDPADFPGASVVTTASAGFIGINNGGDDLFLYDNFGNLVASVSNISATDQSSGRDPDFTGSFADHSTINAGAELFSPGRENVTATTPVELASFNAEITADQTVLLTWNTASELNNAFFAIEKSINGLSFESIGRVKGQGTTTIPQAYQFVDVHPTNGLNYYRLRQVDLDGAEEVHRTLVVDVQASTEEALMIFPTVALSTLNIRYNNATEQPANIQVFNMNGQLVTTDQLGVGTLTKAMDISHLAAGMYLIRVTNNHTVATKSFQKQ